MPMPGAPATTDTKQGALEYVKAWGTSSLPATITATLITAQHLRPFQTLPMLFPPVLLFSSYLNVNGYPVDSAGITSAWSAAYLVLARRRKQVFRSKFGARGITRGVTLGLCAVNFVGGAITYTLGKRGDPDGVFEAEEK